MKQFLMDDDTHKVITERATVEGITLVNALRRLLGLPLLPKDWRKKERPAAKP